jgi:hypothetical protein
MGAVSDELCRRVREKLRSRGLVVWYDPGGLGQPVAEQLASEGEQVLQDTGSIYELLYAAEKYLRTPDPPRLLCYVPRTLTPEQNPLYPLEQAGAVFGLDRGEQLAAVAAKVLGQGPDVWEGMSLAELDRAADRRGTDDLIRMKLGTDDPAQIAWKVILETQETTGELRKLREEFLRERLAMADGAGAFSQRLKECILLGELAAVQPELALPGFTPTATAAGVCRGVAERWRDSDSKSAAYVETARSLERKLRLAELARQGPVGVAQTFPCNEWRRLAEATRLAETQKLEEAARLCEEGVKSFWSRRDEDIRRAWQGCHAAVRLLAEVGRVRAELADAGGASPAELVQRYTRPEGGWHVLDRVARRLPADQTDRAVRNLLRVAHKGYDDCCAEMAEHLADAVEREGLDFPGLAHQREFWREQVQPLLSKGRTAIFWLDALRYEMAVELEAMLEGTAHIDLTFAVATLPAVTRVGMAALLPGAENGLSLVDAAGTLRVQVGDKELADSAARDRYLAERLGRPPLILSLDEAVNLDPEVLEHRLAGESLVFLRSPEIDRAGENDSAYQGRRTMSLLLDDLRQAVGRLAAAGVEHFLLAVDHGFLLHEPIALERFVSSPGGHPLEEHRRVWIGKGGRADPAYLRFRADELELGGDLEFAFPRGLNVFRVRGGSKTYFHGGLSLQELVVPVLRLRLAAGLGDAGQEEVEVRLEKGKITNRLFSVFLTWSRKDFLTPSVRLRCRVVAGERVIGSLVGGDAGFHADSGELELKGTDKVRAFIQLDEEAPPQGELRVEVLDAATGAVLCRSPQVPYLLTF